MRLTREVFPYLVLRLFFWGQVQREPLGQLVVVFGIASFAAPGLPV